MSSMPKLEIRSTQAKLEYSIEKPSQQIRQFKAEQSIEQPPAKVSIQQRQGKLTIDQTKAWNNIDLKSIFKRTESMVSDARQSWIQGITRMSREGDELMRIEQKINPIPGHAEQNARFEFEIEPGAQPVYDLVDIKYEPSFADIEIEPNQTIIHTERKNPHLFYQPGKVNIYMDKYPSVQIDWKV